MPEKKGKKHRKHTPIVSEAQRKLFGAELKRRQEGKRRQMPGITTAELIRHLREAAGRTLPERATKKRDRRNKRSKR